MHVSLSNHPMIWYIKTKPLGMRGADQKMSALDPNPFPLGLSLYDPVHNAETNLMSCTN